MLCAHSIHHMQQKKNVADTPTVCVVGSTGTHFTASEYMTKSSIKMKTSSIFSSRSHHNSYRERDVHNAPSNDIVIFCSCSHRSTSFLFDRTTLNPEPSAMCANRRKPLLACHLPSHDALANYKSHLKSLNMHKHHSGETEHTQSARAK